MILDDLVAVTKTRLNRHQKNVPLATIRQIAQNMHSNDKTDFLEILKQQKLSIISEVKRSSPSKGTIVTKFPYQKIAREYQAAGVDTISVLTEPDYFNGQLKYLREISKEVSVPTLRKDFTIDPYMVYEAKANGAGVILLIAGILDDNQLVEYRQIAESLGMQAIVEAYTEPELKRALKSSAKIIGINNRNLKDFTVDFDNSLRLKKLVPESIPVIAESGIKSTSDVTKLRNAGFNGILVGETLMKSADKAALIKTFQEA